MNKKTEIATLDSQSTLVFNTLQTALDKGVDADNLEKMLNIQMRIMDKQAEQSFYVALAEAQHDMPAVGKNQANSQTKSKYADLSAIQTEIVPVYTAYGFSLSFGTERSEIEDHIKIICDVNHSDGYSRRYDVDMPLDLAGAQGTVNKTRVHGTGSAMKYGQRYLTCLVFNVNIKESGDDDGNAAGNGGSPHTLDDHQCANIEALMDEVGANVPHFLKHFKITKVKDLPQSRLQNAIKMLEAKRKGGAK